MRENLFGMERGALEAVVLDLNEPAYRARQLYLWMYRRRARSIEAMSDLGKALRERLASGYELRWPVLEERRCSADGTIKYLFSLDGGSSVEAVFIPEQRRRTICVSTQAGCPLRCAFCLTGIGGYRRNLRSSEILGQVATVMEDVPREERGWNLVMMGMGEPLLNYEATVSALRTLMDPDGFGIAAKKLTLSTVGILPALDRLAHEPLRPNLAISLHAANRELRGRLMPIDEKFPLPDVIAAARRYPIPRGGLVTYEYVLLRGVNDSAAHAHDLARLLSGTRAKINLIPLNPAPEIPFDPPTSEAVEAFCSVLAAAHFTVAVRRPRGQDILAACGQLHLRREPNGASAPPAVA